jgi:hypothetical protein
MKTITTSSTSKKIQTLDLLSIYFPIRYVTDFYDIVVGVILTALIADYSEDSLDLNLLLSIYLSIYLSILEKLTVSLLRPFKTKKN